MISVAKKIISTTVERLFPSLWLEFRIIKRDRHFEPEYWLIPLLCDRNSDAVDVGGNQGQFSYYMAKFSHQVHVFEPNPICLASLRRIKPRNAKIYDIGLSDADGVALMRFDPNNTGIGTIEPANALDNNSGIKKILESHVSIRRLDNFDFSKVAFVKIDVEGHEPSVIRGGLGLIAKSRPSLLIECEVRHNPTAFLELEAMLTSLGYDGYYLHDGRLHVVNNADITDLQSMPPKDGRPYINNFLFLPHERSEILETLRHHLRGKT